MEKLTGILDNIKERLSSPLIFSFILSWAFVNWKITIVLLWYDPPNASQGHLSLIEYIRSQLNLIQSFWLPFLAAVLYTFASPVVRNVIRAFYTWTRKWGDQWNLDISKDGSIPMEKFLMVQAIVSEKRQQLQTIIEKENETIDKLQKTETALLTERREHDRLQIEHNKAVRIVDNLHHVAVMDGEWNKIIKGDNGTSEITHLIQVNNGSFFVRSGSSQSQYQINEFVFDLTTRRIQFILFNINQAGVSGQTDYLLSVLTLHSQEHLSGFEYRQDGRFQVDYHRPKVPVVS